MEIEHCTDMLGVVPLCKRFDDFAKKKKKISYFSDHSGLIEESCFTRKQLKNFCADVFLSVMPFFFVLSPPHHHIF